MVKELIKVELERENTNMKWGLVIQGGADLALTAKIATVKRFSPADRAGLEKMDYVYSINGKEVFGMSQPEITKEILNAGLNLTLEIERGTFIVPSFDEIWPDLSKESLEGGGASKKSKKMGMDYILEAMEHHGLGHLPQPDNFTTVGKLGIEVNQYNNPIECYSDGTIEDMRDEKAVLEFPEAAEKILAANAQKHKSLQDESKVKKFDPKRSSVFLTIQEQNKMADSVEKRGV